MGTHFNLHCEWGDIVVMVVVHVHVHVLVFVCITCNFFYNLQDILYRSTGISMQWILPFNSVIEQFFDYFIFNKPYISCSLRTCTPSIANGGQSAQMLYYYDFVGIQSMSISTCTYI